MRFKFHNVRGGKPPWSLMRWLSSPLRRDALCQVARCPFTLPPLLSLRCCCELMKTSRRVGEAAQIFERSVSEVNERRQTPNLLSRPPGWNQSHGSAFPSISIWAALPGTYSSRPPAWITTCQDVAYFISISLSLSLHTCLINTQGCKHKHASSMCLVEWPDKKTWHYLLVRSCTSASTRTHPCVSISVCLRARTLCSRNVNVISVLMTFSPLLMPAVFYKYRADILGCVITAPQQHAAYLLAVWQWPSSSPLSSVWVLLWAKLLRCPVCAAESSTTLKVLMLLLTHVIKKMDEVCAVAIIYVI